MRYSSYIIYDLDQQQYVNPEFDNGHVFSLTLNPLLATSFVDEKPAYDMIARIRKSYKLIKDLNEPYPRLTVKRITFEEPTVEDARLPKIVDITVSGVPGSGKSVIAGLIGNLLHTLNVKIIKAELHDERTLAELIDNAQNIEDIECKIDGVRITESSSSREDGRTIETPDSEDGAAT